MYNRRAFKREAKQCIRASTPHFMLVSLVYCLLTTGLSTVASWLSAGGFSSAYYGGGILSLFLTILVALFSIVMGVGFSNYALCLARGKPTGWNSLFQPFSYSGRALGTPLLSTLFIFLWGLIPITISAFSAFLIMPSDLSPELILVCAVIYYLIVAAVFVLFYFFMLRYSMATFALVDDPNAGVMESIRRSVRMMNPFKGKLFLLELSFLGWILLAEFIFLLVVSVAAFVIFLQGGFDWVPHAWKILQQYPDPWLLSEFTERLSNQMAPWILLGEVLSLPLVLWISIYIRTTLARFYNYVGGYDYHQYMLNHQPQAGPVSSEPPTGQPTPEPRRPSGPPAGGYYTPQPYTPKPPDSSAPLEQPAADTPPAPDISSVPILLPETPAQQPEAPSKEAKMQDENGVLENETEESSEDEEI